MTDKWQTFSLYFKSLLMKKRFLVTIISFFTFVFLCFMLVTKSMFINVSYTIRSGGSCAVRGLGIIDPMY